MNKLLLSVLSNKKQLVIVNNSLFHVTKIKLNEDKETMNIDKYTPDRIRNFSIIAHIDHGKSTLADRLLELTGTIDINESSKNKQVLDRLEVERKRGITVKAQTASMFYKYKNEDYLLNLIDTPGHVDFSFEVTRSLKACQGCILIVDATQGIQAQTIANFFTAFEAGTFIIPVINKIDLKTANIESTKEQMNQLLDLKKEEIISISAKTGYNCNLLLDEIVKRMPIPIVDRNKPFKALIFDLVYSTHRGAIILVSCFDGEIKSGDKVKSYFTKKTYEVQEVGILRPDFSPSLKLSAGQVGYMICNMRNLKEVFVGDTIHHLTEEIIPLSEFVKPKPMVFSGFFPEDNSTFALLRKAIDKLCLSDSSVSVSDDNSPVLGRGYRLGFLGLLHMEIFKERLEAEFDQSVIITAPNVPYKVKLTSKKLISHYNNQTDIIIVNPTMWPNTTDYSNAYEPVVLGTIVCPKDKINEINKLCLDRRGIFESKVEMSGDRLLLKYKLPMNEIILDFFDRLKQATSGFASFDYEDIQYEKSDLVKLTVCLNDAEVEELTQIVHVAQVQRLARSLVEKMRDQVPPKRFAIAIQAKVGGKVLARENIKSIRKDPTAKHPNAKGDLSRKLKLLKTQSEQEKREKSANRIQLNKNILINILKKD